MIFKSMLLTSFLFTSLVSSSFAQDSRIKNDPALRIESMTVTEIESILPEQPTKPTPPVPPSLPTLPTNPVNDVIMVIDSLIALGKKIWPIVEAGRPVITTKMAPTVSIFPHTEGENPALNQLANWSMPVIRSFRVSYKNGLKSEVVAFTYSILFQYNGDFNGVGKYVTNLKVQASDIYCSWGFSFDATSELVGIANVGSKTSPVASGVIQIAYAVKGLLNESRSAQSFYVDGLGNVQVLNN